MDWEKQLDMVGNMLMFGFGDKVIKGFIPRYLSGISIDACIDYVQNNKDLLANVPENYWVKLRTMAKVSKIEISVEEISLHLQKSRPDLLSIIINHPNGHKWLTDQVENCRHKLGYK